ncbi:Bestrophin-1 [Taenia crassiceps]|uniref:Bestrophin homolog n=1 Tax=Taenia crassiceps TaxID=6207 RepID=A0ABR4Q236_9CEST
MTVQYNQDVLTGGPVVFLRLLLRWKGCVIKLIYIDFIVFMLAYAVVSCVYRFALTASQQKQFESVVLYVFDFQQMIPISFILGFYVQLVFSRFWQQFNSVPWVFTPTLAVIGAIQGEGRARAIRRTCVRYMNASLIIAASRLHVAAKKRFPTTQHLVQAGILTQREGDLIDSTDPVAAQPFLPLVWATSISMRAEKDGYIRNPHALVNLIQVINSFRESLLKLFLMDKVCVPLVYTQVVTLAVYSYFLSSIIGRQFIVNTSDYSEPFRKDYYVPLYTILEFIVYMGWLKVAETLVNPMGEDDEDFDINAIIDSNWSYGMHMVDRKHHPTELVRDKFWDSANVSLPHTADSKKLQSSQMIGSVFNIDVLGTDPHDRSLNVVSAMNLRTSRGLDDHHDAPRESLRPRIKSSESVELHTLPSNPSPTSCSLQSSVISPSTNTGEATLPALAEVDEESASDVKGEPGTSLGDGDELNRTDDQGDDFSSPEKRQSTSRGKKSAFTIMCLLAGGTLSTRSRVLSHSADVQSPRPLLKVGLQFMDNDVLKCIDELGTNHSITLSLRGSGGLCTAIQNNRLITYVDALAALSILTGEKSTA